MRLRHIEVFHAVYTTGSITAAAKQLSVTQPSISKVLAHAEQGLGYALFERVRGSLIPTPEAHRLFKNVATVYQDMEQLKRLARNLKTSNPSRIRIATTPALSIDLTPSAIASFMHTHGETEFEIETLHYDEIAVALEDSSIDIGLAFDPPPRHGLVVEEIAEAELVVLAPPELKISEDGVVRLRDLAGLPFIELSSRGPLGRTLTQRLENSGVKFNTLVSCETYHIAKSLAAEGIGITIIDEVTALSPGHGEVAIWRLAPAIRFPISVVHLDTHPLSVVSRQFVEHLTQKARQYLKKSET